MEKKICDICENNFIPTGKNQKTCNNENCKKEKRRLATQKYRKRKYAELGKPDRHGIGKGGGQDKGKESAFYKNGLKSDFINKRYLIKEDIRYCQRCMKDLKNVGRYYWCLHHKDHNRKNNSRDNLELLCKRCHQIEHECWKAFEGATTIRKE